MFQQAPQNNIPAPQTTTGLPPHGVIVRGCRLANMHCYEPTKSLNGDMVYSVTLLIPKYGSISHIEAAIQAAYENGIKGVWKGNRPYNLQLPLKDGDMYAAQKPDKRKMYIGQWYINIKQNPEKGKPTLLNENRQVSTDKLEIQSGDYADVVVEFIPYDNKSQGISGIPKVILKTMTGERFAKGISQEDAIAAIGGINTSPTNYGGFGDLSSIF